MLRSSLLLLAFILACKGYNTQNESPSFYDIHKIGEIHNSSLDTSRIKIALIEPDFQGNVLEPPPLVDLSLLKLFEASNTKARFNIHGLTYTKLGQYLPENEKYAQGYYPHSKKLFTNPPWDTNHALQVISLYNGLRTPFFEGGMVKGGHAHIYHYELINSFKDFKGTAALSWWDLFKKRKAEQGKTKEEIDKLVEKTEKKSTPFMRERFKKLISPSFRQIFDHIFSQDDIDFISISAGLDMLGDPFNEDKVPEEILNWLADGLEQNDQVIIKSAGNSGENLSDSNESLERVIRSLLSHPKLKERIVLAVNLKYDQASPYKLNNFPVSKVKRSDYPGEEGFLQEASLGAIGHDIIFDEKANKESGTSLSAPLIAGYLALLKEKTGKSTIDTVRYAKEQAVSFSDKTTYGRGAINSELLLK